MDVRPGPQHARGLSVEPGSAVVGLPGGIYGEHGTSRPRVQENWVGPPTWDALDGQLLRGNQRQQPRARERAQGDQPPRARISGSAKEALHWRSGAGGSAGRPIWDGPERETARRKPDPGPVHDQSSEDVEVCARAGRRDSYREMG